MDRHAEPRSRARLGLVLVLGALGLNGLAAGQVVSSPIAGLRADVAALMVQGVAGGALPLAVSLEAAEASTDAGESLRLPFVVELPGLSLLAAMRKHGMPSTSSEELAVEVYAYAVDLDGRVVGHVGQRLVLPLAEVGERLSETGLRFRGRIKVPAGNLSLRLLVLEPHSRTFGFAVETVELGSERPHLTTLRVTGGCGDWVEAGSAALPMQGRDSGRSVLVAGESRSATTRLFGAEALPAEGDWRLALSLQPLPAGDASATHVAAQVDRVTRRKNGFEIEFQLTPPRELPQGRYAGRLTAGIGTATEHAAAPVEIWILAPDSAIGTKSCVPTWGEVYRQAVALEAGAVSSRVVVQGAEPPSPEVRASERQLRSDYLGLLGDLAGGRSMAETTRELGELEDAFVRDRFDGFPRLRAIELAVDGELAAREPRTLPVILVLHERSYEEHFNHRRYGLATHAREVVVRLVEERLASSDDDERRLVSRILTSLADRAERHRVAGAAQELLERALRLDGENNEAKLLLATSYERTGRPASARGLLEQVVATDAGHREARLRLAVLSARAGRRDEAELLLRRLLEEGGGGWGRSIAFQSLARVLFDHDRFEDAVELLADARAERPDDQRLALLGAYALDRAGRPTEAAEWIAALPPAPEQSPRLRYGELSSTPSERLSALRELVARSLVVRLPVVARAVDALDEENR